jgi:hypothetical protein
MVDAKVSLKNVQPGLDEYEIGVNMVTRIEVEPMDEGFVMVTLHYYDTPDAQDRNELPKVMKFAIKDDGAQALSKSLAESVDFNIAQGSINKANERVH